MSLATSLGFAQEQASQQPAARIQGILINADDMFRDSEKEMVELNGHVQIIYQGQHIKADRARVFLRTKRAELFGNVEITDVKSSIKGDQVFLDYENNTGVIYNGFVQSGLVRFSGDRLEKIGDSEFIVTDADYTACTNCPATWSFSGTAVRAQMGGYAYIKSAILRLGDFPVLWLPYIAVPLKSDRQSGLLTPGFEQSDTGGFTFIQPYFWAISRSSDATITAKNYEHRGLKGLLEYRYMLNEDSSGLLNAAILNDRAFGQDQRLNTYRGATEQGSPLERWYVNYQQYYAMPDDIVARAQVNLASDLQYPRDFPLETNNYGDPAMENRVSVTKNTKDTHASIDTSYYVNMLQADPRAGNDDAVHRAPELRYAQAQKNIGDTNFIYSWNLDYVNFTRAGNGYDDMATTTINGTKYRYVQSNCAGIPNWSDYQYCHRVYDGSFDPDTDLIRTGQRLDFQPALYYPFQISDGFDIVPMLNYRETHYYFNEGDDQSYVRRYLRTSVTSRMTFSGIYGDQLDPKATRYKHEIIPELTYTDIPWINQKQHPFFGTGPLNEAPYSSRDGISDGDLTSPYGLQFDYTDRIYDRNLITLGLTNKITEKTWVGDRPVYQQIASLKLLQSYDVSQSEAGTGTRQPWSDMMAILDVRLKHFQTYSIVDYFPYQNVSNISSRVRVMNDMGQFGQIGLTQQYKITPGQAVDVSSRTEDYTFAAGFITPYVNLMGQVVYDANWQAAVASAGKPVKAWAYIAQFKPPGDCWLITLIQDQVIGGEANTRLNFEFTFDGNPKPPLPPEALDQFGF